VCEALTKDAPDAGFSAEGCIKGIEFPPELSPITIQMTNGSTQRTPVSPVSPLRNYSSGNGGPASRAPRALTRSTGPVYSCDCCDSNGMPLDCSRVLFKEMINLKEMVSKLIEEYEEEEEVLVKEEPLELDQ